MKSSSRLLIILNTITLLLMLFANYAANKGIFSSENVADVSHKYDTLFAPAGYAFAIWGVIFLLSIGFVIYQWVLLHDSDKNGYILRTGIWFSIGNVANAAWLYCWLNERVGLSVMCILLLLVSLLVLTVKLRMELDDVPVRTIFFVWWPVTVYLGWIMVATIACVASWLTSIEWSGFGISENAWMITMIVSACLIYLLLLQRRNLREAAAVGAWAFIAIAVRQWQAHKEIVTAAVCAAIILITASGFHAIKNRKYAIPFKLKRREW